MQLRFNNKPRSLYSKNKPRPTLEKQAASYNRETSKTYIQKTNHASYARKQAASYNRTTSTACIQKTNHAAYVWNPKRGLLSGEDSNRRLTISLNTVAFNHIP